MRANRYVSYLAAEIEPKAVSTLNEFERATQRTFANIENFSNRGLSKMGLGLDAGQTQRIRATEQQLRRTRTEMAQTGAQARKTAADTSVMAQAFTRSAVALQVVQGPLGPLAGRLSALGAAMRSLTGFALTGVLAGGASFALGSIANDYAVIGDRLRPLYGRQQDFNRAMSDVVGIAGRTRQALEPVADLYARMTAAGRDAGVSQQRISRLTETVAKAARLSGGTAQTQQAGIGQFSQGFGSGNLGGEELRSVRENTLRLAQALAEGLDVPMSQLKELGARGALTPEIIASALERASARIEVEYSRMPKRIGTSLTELANNMGVFVGRLDEATGATSFLANALSLLANNLDTVGALAGIALVAFSSRAVVAGAAAVISFAAAQRQAIGTQIQFSRAVAEGNAGLLYSNRALQQHAAAAVTGAREEVAAVQSVIAARRTESEQLRANLPLLDRQIRAQERAKEVARRLDAASRAVGGGGRPDLVKAATEDLNQSLRARAITEQSLANVNRQLAVAEGQLSQATGAVTAAQARLGVVMNAAPVAAGRASRAMLILQGAMTRAAAAGASLVAFLGGPWGVAFTLASSAAIYLATRTTELDAAMDRLGITQDDLAQRINSGTIAYEKQTDAVRRLYREKLNLDLQDDRKAARDVRADFGKRLDVLGGRTGGLIGMATVPGDIRRQIQNLQRDFAAGRPLEDIYADLKRIQRITPGLFKNDILEKTVGTTAGMKDFLNSATAYQLALEKVTEAEKERDDALAKIDAPAPVIAKPRTRAQLEAAAAALAAKTELQRAQADLKEIRASGKGEDETDDAYIQRLAQAQQRVRALQDAERERKRGLSELGREQRAVETASDRADRLSNLMDRFTDDTPIRRLQKLQNEAAAAKRAIDDLVGERVEGYDGAFSQADADARKREIDDYAAREARRPAREMLESMRQEASIQRLINAGRADEAESLRRRVELQRQMGDLLPQEVADLERAAAVLRDLSFDSSMRDVERELEIQTLVLQGRGNEADLLRTRNELQRELGPLSEDELRRLAENQDRQQQINRLQEERNARMENYLGLVGATRDGIRDMIAQFADDPIGAVKGFASKVRSAFLEARAEEIVVKLFGDPEQRWRDEMTRGLNASASRLVKSADGLDRSAQAIVDAADTLAGAGVAGPAGVAPVAGDPRAAFLSDMGAIVATLRDPLRAVTSMVRVGNPLRNMFVGGDSDARHRARGSHGVDLRAAVGTQLSAVIDGVLSTSRSERGGLQAHIRSLDGRVVAGFAHLQDVNRSLVGQVVRVGQVIGTTGRSGGVAPHLHASLRVDGRTRDPMRYFGKTIDFGAGSSTGAGAVTTPLQRAASSMEDVARTVEGLTDEVSSVAEAAQEIVVTATRPPVAVDPAAADENMPRSATEAMNRVGREFSSAVFGPNSPVTRVLGRVGDFLEGTAYGGIGGGLAGMTGAKTSKLGAEIGGGIGNIIGKDVLGPMLGKLGSFAGPLGAIAGGVIGGLVGGAFKKTKTGTATITDTSGNYSMGGNSGSAKGVAAGAAGDVTGGLQRIADALGGSIGGFNVSIGTRDGKWRVDPSGRGATKTKKGAVDFGKEGQEAAVRFAILDALKDGAIQGIREGSKRLLQVGKDLEAALDKALKFEDVFRRLKRFKDPVGAAIDDLNREFDQLRKIFQEAGASAAEFAQLEELYGYERAEAIKQATNQTIESLNDFIQGLTSGPESPLGKRTVYDNAKAEVEKFRADIAAGKAVDSDKLIQALENFQDASQTLYGSRSPFFQDFDDILALAKQARDNIAAPPSAANPNLPASPFDDPELRRTWMGIHGQTTTQTELLHDIRDSLRGMGGGGGSSLDLLPGFVGRYDAAPGF